MSRNKEFLKLQPQEVFKFLSMDEIIVKLEESIFECILCWIEVSPALTPGSSILAALPRL